jgi:uncharacterized protein HemY
LLQGAQKGQQPEDDDEQQQQQPQQQQQHKSAPNLLSTLGGRT